MNPRSAGGRYCLAWRVLAWRALAWPDPAWVGSVWPVAESVRGGPSWLRPWRAEFGHVEVPGRPRRRATSGCVGRRRMRVGGQGGSGRIWAASGRVQSCPVASSGVQSCSAGAGRIERVQPHGGELVWVGRRLASVSHVELAGTRSVFKDHRVGECGGVVRHHELIGGERELLVPQMPRAVAGWPRVAGRQVVNGMVYKIRIGLLWRDLPERYEPRRGLPPPGRDGGSLPRRFQPLRGEKAPTASPWAVQSMLR